MDRVGCCWLRCNDQLYLCAQVKTRHRSSVLHELDYSDNTLLGKAISPRATYIKKDLSRKRARYFYPPPTRSERPSPRSNHNMPCILPHHTKGLCLTMPSASLTNNAVLRVRLACLLPKRDPDRQIKKNTKESQAIYSCRLAVIGPLANSHG